MVKKKAEVFSTKHEFKNVWSSFKNEQDVMSFAQGYKRFLDTAKTERLACDEIHRIAVEAGYISLEELIKTKKPLEANQGIYAINRGKSIVVIKGGRKKIESGIHIVGAHLDSPRIDLKPFPLYEDSGLALFKTHYYGGIKKYQWVSIPLALYGVVCLTSGKTVSVNIGDKEDDPVFMITDLLPHLAKDQYQKKLHEGFSGEGLNLLMGSKPLESAEKEKVKENILKILYDQYEITEADFVSAELEIVPAGFAKDAGLDRSMVVAYGHDDRVCTYTALKAILDSKASEHTMVGLFTDKEEVGSRGNTGAESDFFEYVLAELLSLDKAGSIELSLKRCFMKSKMLSADVCAAFDPNYSEVYDKRNTPMLGNGVLLMKYSGSRGKGGCSDANAEFVAYVRSVFEKNNVVWQTGELGKVDQGGGGTIAFILANKGADVIDCGVAVLSMHGPWEIISKGDLYMTYLGYKAFVEAQ